MGEIEAQHATVLVVDDNEANRALARSTLEDEGYRVILANEGAEGIAAFEREAIDCIVLDVRMPGIDGFAVCERVRTLPRGPETPVIFLTALRDVETFDRALRAGGDDFLTKPVRPTELLVRVQTALKLRRARVEIREHYALLMQQRDDLLRLQLQKERLMAFVVHDLKNPLAAVDLHAQLLLRDPSLSQDARESITQIRTETRQLNGMILDLLDISKADEGRLSPKRTQVALKTMIQNILADLGVQAVGRNVTLRAVVDETTSVLVDEGLFRRTLTNLVDNALRYAPGNTEISVVAKAGKEATEVRITDAGKGIPPSMRERVFDPFVQADAGDRIVDRAGRGLGLTFCKLAVEAHGGRIWIEDAAPGAVFCLTVPHGA